MSQLYVPSAGVIEGVHHVSIRPAQGELGELIFNVPAGATITDVADLDPDRTAEPNSASIVSLWRFDPDTRKLRVTLEPGAVAAIRPAYPLAGRHGPLPFEQRVG